MCGGRGGEREMEEYQKGIWKGGRRGKRSKIVKVMRVEMRKNAGQ